MSELTPKPQHARREAQRILNDLGRGLQFAGGMAWGVGAILWFGWPVALLSAGLLMLCRCAFFVHDFLDWAKESSDV